MSSKQIDQKMTELVRSGGYIYAIAETKLRHVRPYLIIALQEIANFHPENIILLPCGSSIDRTVNRVNASVYFSKPGIRTITGLEILAKIIDPHLKVPPNSFKYEI